MHTVNIYNAWILKKEEKKTTTTWNMIHLDPIRCDPSHLEKTAFDNIAAKYRSMSGFLVCPLCHIRSWVSCDGGPVVACCVRPSTELLQCTSNCVRMMKQAYETDRSLMLHVNNKINHSRASFTKTENEKQKQQQKKLCVPMIFVRRTGSHKILYYSV